MDVKKLTQTAAMAALLCLAGMIMRWASPALVPFSLLPLFVFLTGLILGPKYGSLAVIVYVFLGFIGLPVFASAPFGGIGYLLKPSAGFLFGYIGAAYVAGRVYNGKNFFTAILGVLGGIIVLYLIGLTYFYLILTYVLNQSTNVSTVLSLGFFPFILGDLLKGGIAAWLGYRIRKRLAETVSFKSV
ncbi:MAG: biotin transporter BioY [Desulfitobacterium sp.]|nr:biotin transporter BioY [Desulfitobacterium sp.]